MRGSPANPHRQCRALTLLELLVALAVMLALTAIILPSATRGLGERAFDSAIDGVQSQMLMARAHAQRTGESVDLRYETEPPRLVATIFDPSSMAERDAEHDAERESEHGAATRVKADETKRIGESWATNRLDDGITLTEIDPRAAQAESISGRADASAFGDVAAGAAAHPAGPIRVAVFLPDGSAILQKKVWIVDGEDRAAAITINPWLGLPNVERIAALVANADAPDADEEKVRSAAGENAAEESRDASRDDRRDEGSER